MDSALMELVQRGRVAAIEAYQQANNKQKFRALVEEEQVLEQAAADGGTAH